MAQSSFSNLISFMLAINVSVYIEMRNHVDMRFQIRCLWNWSSMCIQACTGERFNGCQTLFAHKKHRICVQMKLTNGSFCFKQLMLHGKEIFLLRFLYLYSCLISSFSCLISYKKCCSSQLLGLMQRFTISLQLDIITLEPCNIQNCIASKYLQNDHIDILLGQP